MRAAAGRLSCGYAVVLYVRVRQNVYRTTKCIVAFMCQTLRVLMVSYVVRIGTHL